MEELICPQCGEKLVRVELAGVFGESYGETPYCDCCNKFFSEKEVQGCVAK